MTDAKATIAINRFGLGARPSEIQEIRRPEAWLLDQLQGPTRQSAELRDLPDSADVFR